MIFEMRVQQKLFEAAEEQMTAWKDPPEEAIEAANVAALVSACTDYPEDLRELLACVFKILKGQFRSNWDDLGRSIDVLTARAVKTARDALETATAYVQRTGNAVGDLTALATAIEALLAHRERILTSWPWSNRPLPKANERVREMLARSQEDFANGRHEDIRDVMARVRAGGSVVAKE
jgi:hypothetical protein